MRVSLNVQACLSDMAISMMWSWIDDGLPGRRAVRRNLEIEGDMALQRAEAQKGLAQRCENGAGIAAQLGAEVLGPVEDAGRLEERDAAVDLVHVVAAAERIQRELGSHDLTRPRCSLDMPDGGCDP